MGHYGDMYRAEKDAREAIIKKDQVEMEDKIEHFIMKALAIIGGGTHSVRYEHMAKTKDALKLALISLRSEQVIFDAERRYNEEKRAEKEE